MTCEHCGQDTDHALCDLCATRTATDLHRLALNYVDSEDPALTPVPAPVGRAAFASKPPVNVAWLSWRQGSDIVPVLLGWAADWADLYHLTGRIPQDVPGLCQWLRNHLGRAAVDHPAISEFTLEVRTLARRSQKYAGRSNPRHIPVTCTTINPDTGQECGARLPISNEDTSEPNQPIRCRQCGTQRTTLQLFNIARHQVLTDASKGVDVEVAAVICGVDVRTIQRWAKSGRVTRDSHGQYHVAGYDTYAG